MIPSNSCPCSLIGVIISAKAEWEATLEAYPEARVQSSPLGDYFLQENTHYQLVFFHEGWGKVAAAAATQYLIDRWQPQLLINLGTCGGFKEKISTGEIILVRETIIYDIIERMGDAREALERYSVFLDLSFLAEPFPQPVRVGRLLSADQDIDPDQVIRLNQEFGAIAADWESGAIAWTARCNQLPLLILRGVSDLVGVDGGELYQQGDFAKKARTVMRTLLASLTAWIACAGY
ncbi:MAG TPA: 5'-methylthioadenosine/S-adenosylhomocysteine nucleosidase [Anaerolineaceae bacterium]|nr:5'-methylthioadenosine/S-adenosylhomocysteine nucleosidase [Anaerolineaceae bacterium]